MPFKGSVAALLARSTSPLIIIYTIQKSSPSFKAVVPPSVWAADCYTVLVRGLFVMVHDKTSTDRESAFRIFHSSLTE